MVVKRYSQVGRIKFGEMFSIVAKLEYIRLLLYVVVGFDLEIEQMDAKTTFLHGDLKGGISVTQLEHYVEKGWFAN